ncbi:hypothetical protein D3C84_1283560 [compost metagenome]
MKVPGVAGGPGVHAATKLLIVLKALLKNLIALGSVGGDFRQAVLGKQCTVDFGPQAVDLGL